MNMNDDLLGDLKPKNEEQERIFKEAIKKILMKVAAEKKARQQAEFRDSNGLFMANSKIRKQTDGFSKDRELRLLAYIPADVAEIAKKMYGDDVLTNKQKFKEAFAKDEIGRYCLTVDPKTI